mmetsp:Transcript_64112/g.111816  ORF Transcript_64112/g.111816 Transcript_64112/m.111816 type:complete len:241 (-) Transcript_64112:292-1014(-)
MALPGPCGKCTACLLISRANDETRASKILRQMSNHGGGICRIVCNRLPIALLNRGSACRLMGRGLWTHSRQQLVLLAYEQVFGLQSLGQLGILRLQLTQLRGMRVLQQPHLSLHGQCLTRRTLPFNGAVRGSNATRCCCTRRFQSSALANCWSNFTASCTPSGELFGKRRIASTHFRDLPRTGLLSVRRILRCLLQSPPQLRVLRPQLFKLRLILFLQGSHALFHERRQASHFSHLGLGR